MITITALQRNRVVNGMLMVFTLAASILLTTAYFLKIKRFCLFEILAVWIIAVAIDAVSFSYFLINRHWIAISNSNELAIVRILYTECLTPLFLAWSLDIVMFCRHRNYRMTGYLITYVCLLLGGRLLSHWGVVHFNSGGYGWYAALKAVKLTASIGAVHLIRHLLRKEGVPHGSILRPE